MLSHFPPVMQWEWQNPNGTQGRPGARVPAVPCCAGLGALVVASVPATSWYSELQRLIKVSDFSLLEVS